MAAINDEPLATLESFLGRSLSQDEGRFSSFGDLCQPYLGELEELSTLHAILYVRFLMTPPASLRNALSFVDNVVERKLPVSTWLARHWRQD